MVCSPSLPVAHFKFYTAWTEKGNHCTWLPSLLLIQVIQTKAINFIISCSVNLLLCYFKQSDNSSFTLSFEGLPPLTGTLTVHVIVDDTNDNHPQFTEEVYNTIVFEDSPTGTVFAIITASDIDEGVSGEIR